jgi:hypothetical protein
MPTYDIIDNRTRELAPEINNFLADSIRAHFAAGYFFLSGFQAIAEHILQGAIPRPNPNLLSPAQPTPCLSTNCHRATLSGCACGWSSAKATNAPTAHRH